MNSREPRSTLSATVLATLLIVTSMFSSVPVRAQDDDANSQTGSINIDLSGERRENPYSRSQDAAIVYFKNFSEATKRMASGSGTALAELPTEVLNYLTGVYLYCAVNNGTCPLVLDALLEIDTVNSRISGQPQCPNMKRFWSAWVKNDMEERHKFLVKTSFINVYSQFNSQTRPRYLKCEDTVKSEISGFSNSEAFFKDRYRGGSPQEKLAARMAALLEQIKSKIPNVFIAMGAQDSSKNEASTTTSKTQAPKPAAGTGRRSPVR